jgi:hypothetical protein
MVRLTEIILNRQSCSRSTVVLLKVKIKVLILIGVKIEEIKCQTFEMAGLCGGSPL